MRDNTTKDKKRRDNIYTPSGRRETPGSTAEQNLTKKTTGN